MSQHTRSSDDTAVIKVSRTVSIGWLVGIVLSVAGWGFSNYVVFVKVADATERNGEELRRISTQINARDVRDAGVEARLIEHERRLTTLEQVRNR